MGIVPKPISDKILFYSTRVANFDAHAEQIGTTPEAVARLQAALAEAKAASKAQAAAQAAARAATQRLEAAAEALTAAGSNIIAQVRTRARTTDDPGVYGLALLPPIADRTPMAPPGTPTRFTFTLHTNGLLLLKWDCKNPRGSSGTVYQVYRRIGASGEFTFIGTSGSKGFLDSTVPLAASELTYRIQAVRSTKAGAAATFNVTFGRTPDNLPLPTLLPRKKLFVRAA